MLIWGSLWPPLSSCGGVGFAQSFSCPTQLRCWGCVTGSALLSLGLWQKLSQSYVAKWSLWDQEQCYARTQCCQGVEWSLCPYYSEHPHVWSEEQPLQTQQLTLSVIYTRVPIIESHNTLSRLPIPMYNPWTAKELHGPPILYKQWAVTRDGSQWGTQEQ